MPALDGLRGLAITLVLLCHCNLILGNSSASHAVVTVWRSRLFGAGWIGVDLFFVLSGFLITGILLATKSSGKYFRSFYARRTVRIFPLYYLFLVVFLFLGGKAFKRSDDLSLFLYYYNFRAVYLQHALPVVNPLWSLAIEEQFYLVWPLVIYFCNRSQTVIFCCGGFIIALLARLVIFPYSGDFQSAYYLTPCRVDELLAGAMLAIWRSDDQLWKKVQRYSNYAASFSGVALLAIWLMTGHFYDFLTWKNTEGFRHSSVLVIGPGITFLGLFFAVLVSKSTSQGACYRFFSIRPLRQLGKYSYGIYIYHWLVILQVSRFTSHTYTLVPLCFLLTYAAAYASFHLYEKHFLRLKRLFPALSS